MRLMTKAWLIETTWTNPTSSTGESYAVALADRGEAVSTLSGVLAPRAA